MRHQILTVAFLLAVVTSGSDIHAQRVITLDLAFQQPGTTRTEPVEVGEIFIIRVTNRGLGPYSVQVDRKLDAIPPLNVPLAPAPAPGATACDTLIGDFTTALQNAGADEAQIARAVSAALATAAGCTPAQQGALEVSIRRQTTVDFGDYKLVAGETFTFTISRGSGNDQKTWTLKVTTGDPGEWRILYGFNFIPNEDETYFLKPRDDGKFDIVPERDHDDWAFAPAVMASWFDRTHRVRGWGWGLSAGLGFETEDPIVFGAVSIVWREDVSFNIGPVFHKQRRLNARLDPATPVAENLSDEQLHTAGYRPNWFFGIGFRFNENPFGKKEDEK